MTLPGLALLAVCALAQDPPSAPPAASEPSVDSAAAALHADPALVAAMRDALELLYARRYPEAQATLAALSARYPGTGIGEVGMAFLYQARMFENQDLRYDASYRQSFEAARAALDAAAQVPGDEAFESLLSTGLYGVDAIHALRKGAVLTALQRALQSMSALDRTRSLAPDLPDLGLAEGMYLYWRSVVTRSTPLLPDFADRRAEGIARMQDAEVHGTLLGPAATLALAYAWLEERGLDQAADRCLHLRARYPDNVINLLTLGRIYTAQHRDVDALEALDDVLRADPANQRSHYLRGVALARLGRHDEAVAAFERYVAFPEVPAALREPAWYRLGLLYTRAGDTPRATYAYAQAGDSGQNAAARRALAEEDAP